MSAKNTLSAQLRYWFPQGRDQDIPYEALADKILAALSAAGFVIVPREPTEEMLFAGSRNQDEPLLTVIRGTWSAMLSAAEGKPSPSQPL